LRKEIELKDEAIHLLFSANRWDLVPEIKDALARGESIVVDRYAYSGIAFSAAKGMDLEWCRAPDVGLPKPDAVIYLNLDKKIASQRGDYGQERYENVDFQEKVKDVFWKLKEDSYWHVIEASRPIEVVHQDCHKIVLETIQRKELQPIDVLWKKI
jgi:dTMP kinase